MQILTGLFILLAFLAVGELTSSLIGNVIPGNVIGMLYLFLALCLKLVKPEWIRQTAQFFLNNMVIFFVPLFMSIMDDWGVIRMNLISWLTILLSTTIFVIIASGAASAVLIRLQKKGGKDE